jgi:hypothetical protein
VFYGAQECWHQLPHITSGAKSAGLAKGCGAQWHSYKFENAGSDFIPIIIKNAKIDIPQFFLNWMR